MFCKKCGSEISDGTKFCSKCGAPTEENSKPTITVAQNETSGSAHSAALIGKIAVLIALICFFFTFMSVSCSGQTREISGTDMIFGDKSVTQEVEAQAGESSGLFNIFVLLSAVSGIAAVAIKKSGISFKLSGLSAILLLIFRFSAKSYYKIGGESLKEWEKNGMDISFGFPLYLAIILFIVGAVFIWSSVNESNQGNSLKQLTAKPKPPAIPVNNTPPADTARETSVEDNSKTE